MIHPSVIIHPKAELASTVDIGPYVVIGQGVSVGEGTTIQSHAVLEGPKLVIGKNNSIDSHAHFKSHTIVADHNRFSPFCVIGGEPQDLKFKGEESTLEIGNFNVFRESVTLNRGTAHGGGVTRIGNHNLIMAYAHVAHDCQIGNYVVMANSVGLAGHVEIQDHAILGGLVGVSQFCRIGQFAYIGGCSSTDKDLPPFMISAGAIRNDIGVRGVNAIGLKRQGVELENIRALKEVYKILYVSDLLFQEALTIVKRQWLHIPQVKQLVEFIESSTQGVVIRERKSRERKSQRQPEDQYCRDRNGISREVSR